jgi:MurNAc alpha-1-phosphate uridylyltransferase
MTHQTTRFQGAQRPPGGAPGFAMLLAAGLGTRMRPLTDTTAKPLLPLAGRPLLDHALDQLALAGVQRVVVNTHWQGERVAAHLAARTAPPHTIIRRESTLLDTGGAVRAALAEGLLGSGPFFIVNGDAFWLDGPVPALARLAAALDPARMDAVLLVHRAFLVMSEVGFGDFMLDKWGGLRRRGEREVAPYVYAGVQLVSPALFEAAPPAPFSMNALWDRAMATGRLRAVVHDGLWFHLTTPGDMTEAEQHLHDPDPATT